MKKLICIKCGQERTIGRRMCRPCYLQYKIKYAANRYKQFGRYCYLNICSACNQQFKAWRKQQLLCKKCHQDKLRFSSETLSSNNYVYTKRGVLVHREIAEQILGRKLRTNEVIHHMDDNPKNNNLNNLIVLDRRAHGRLHKFLDFQRVIFEKSKNENVVNCWDTLRVLQTTAWLEMTSAKVIKLWELGNQQPSSLTGEGSETTDDTPETDNAVGDDIVQTTTRHKRSAKAEVVRKSPLA